MVGSAVALALVAGLAPLTAPAPAAAFGGRFESGPIHGAGFMTVMAELPSGRLVAGGDSQGFFVSDDSGPSKETSKRKRREAALDIDQYTSSSSPLASAMTISPEAARSLARVTR